MKMRKGSMWRDVLLLLTGVLHVLGSRGPLELPNSREITSKDRDDFVLMEWGYDREVQEIVIELQTPIASSIALGLGPDRSLNETDFVVAGWNKHNETYFYDAHTEGEWPPVKDKSQDYVLLDLSRNDTHSIMRVWRKWFTCDRHDQEIENDTVRVMVVIGDTESFELTDDRTFRKSIFFLEILEHIMYPDSVLIHELKLIDHIVSDLDTSYACTFLPMPRVSKKHHIIKYEPIEDPDTIGIVHHILIYICGNNTTLMSDVGDCYGSDTRYSQCMSATFGWAVGGEPFDYPSECGVSVGTPDDPMYARIEIHYSNFENKEGLKDSSGMRLYYTPDLRRHDCSTLMTGIFTFPVQFIPPGSTEFRNYGLCNTHLLETMLGRPIPDLTVTTFLLHGHLTARGMRIMHYRNGTLIGSLGEDKKYDFSFQQVRNLPKEVTVKMGDQILVECTASTMDREGVTFEKFPSDTETTAKEGASNKNPKGGPSTLNEMCLGFLFYYPALPVASCWSLMDIHYVANALGLEKADSIMDAILNIDAVEWDDENKAIAQKAVMEAPHLALVENRQGRRVNETSPLPPISLPPPYYCEDDTLN